jgi:hypothetical protein
LAALATGAADRQRAGSAVPSLHTGWPLWIASVVNVTSATLDGMRGASKCRCVASSRYDEAARDRRCTQFAFETKRSSPFGFVIHTGTLFTMRPRSHQRTTSRVSIQTNHEEHL